jgi:hypothetical protein
MVINKMGNEHLIYGINNHDYGFETDIMKCVVDGCSEGKHSEVGAKLFCHMFESSYNIDMTFDFLLKIFNNIQDIKNYLCFTVLYIIENSKEFIVNYCGDGYIITQDKNDFINYIKLDDTEYPMYYIYKFVPTCFFNQDEVKFNQMIFSKEEFKNVGVATDGLRYVEHFNEFKDLLLLNKPIKIKRYINKNQNIFKDDITVVL